MIYTVYVKTGDETLAGTDSNVYIQLTGTDGQTERVHLPARDVFAFEAGATDKFALEVPELGDLTQCCIGHDNAEGDSGWYVESVRVSDDQREWIFPFAQWLGVEESGNLEACIAPSS